ncbi:MAG TPA: fused MFS/spermidine synthase [Solirubrobacteraceae bacterium]|nr:fused MFS/spermidine synthase [Solirubrobacteraceae bacterium]
MSEEGAATRGEAAGPGTERRRAVVRLPIEVVVFVVGSASLGAEIAAARLLAPYFGASTIVWANTIATVLVALAFGYWIGGKMADRRPEARGMALVVVAASILLAVVPFVGRPFLSESVKALDSISAGAFLGSLVGVLVLVAVPVVLLGAVAPYAVRLKVASVQEAGSVAGRLYAISTAGSLVGTFLSALLLIPVIGTRRTFLTFALALALVGALGLGRRWLLVPLVIAVLIALPTGTIKPAEAGTRLLQETETPYQYARVVQDADGTRRLELNEGVATHSLARPGTVLTGDYWDDFLVLPFAGSRPAPPRRIAILGNAAGTTARAYATLFPRTRIDAVEIDGALTTLGERWFGLLPGPNLRVHTADARPWLARQPDGRYDAIFVDAYRQPYIPFYLATREFFALVRRKLAPGGMVIVNIGHPEGSTDLERVLGATMRAAFPVVDREEAEPTNTLGIAATAPLSVQRLAAARTPPRLRGLAAQVAARLRPALPGGAVYTDDRAPVEWLIDASIVHVAADGQR